MTQTGQARSPEAHRSSPQEDDHIFRDELLKTIQALRAFAISLVGRTDRADDLVQETLVKAWQHRKSFQLGTNMGAWLFTILRNEFYSQIRKRRREVEDVDGAIAARVPQPPAQHAHLDLSDMRNALLVLPVDQREAVLLVSASDMSYEEAAAICGVAVGTIKSRVNRGRAKLARLLGVNGAWQFSPDEDLKAMLNKS